MDQKLEDGVSALVNASPLVSGKRKNQKLRIKKQKAPSGVFLFLILSFCKDQMGIELNCFVFSIVVLSLSNNFPKFIKAITT